MADDLNVVHILGFFAQQLAHIVEGLEQRRTLAPLHTSGGFAVHTLQQTAHARCQQNIQRHTDGGNSSIAHRTAPPNAMTV